MTNLEDTSDRELVMTRVIDAAPERVFAAFTDPTQMVQWWGPNGYTTTLHEMDVRPGGVTRFDMHAPNGTVFPNRLEYQLVERPAKLVYKHGTDDPDDPQAFLVTITFEPAGQRTRLTMRSLFPTVADVARVRGFGAEELGQQTLEKLARYLTGSA